MFRYISPKITSVDVVIMAPKRAYGFMAWSADSSLKCNGLIMQP